MKKFLSIAILSLCVLFAGAQSTTLPRWGGGPPQNDNTGRVLTYALKTVATTSATATLTQVPNAFETVIKIGTLSHALSDSLNSSLSYVGDKVTFVFTADGSGRVVTFTGSLHSVGTVSVGASLTATTTFIYMGTSGWIEVGRAVNAN